MFEERLGGLVSSVLGLALVGAVGGCSGATPTSKDTDTDTGTDTGTPTDLSEVCDGATPPDDVLLAMGHVEITPGGDCPDAAEAQLEVFGCTFLEWQQVTCGFDSVARDQVFIDDGYGGYYADAGATPTYYEPGPVVDVCYYEGVFYLDPDHPTCGRPLLDEGRAVVAPVRSGSTRWAGSATSAGELSGEVRAAVAAWWLQSAVLEHASVASFACFSLDLMRLGAPPELLRDAHQAAIDEVEHARLCFALASRYEGRPLGPGPLETPERFTQRTTAEVVEALVREGCVGETVAAVDAAARLAVATDPQVRDALQIIVRDESAHASLAWRALRWMLEQDTDGHLRARVQQVFADEELRWRTEPVEPTEASVTARAHGLLGSTEGGRVVTQAFEQVIGPSRSAL